MKIHKPGYLRLMDCAIVSKMLDSVADKTKVLFLIRVLYIYIKIVKIICKVSGTNQKSSEEFKTCDISVSTHIIQQKVIYYSKNF